MGKRLIPYEALRGKGIVYSKPHLWRLEKQKKFPRRIYTNPDSDGGGRSSYAYDEDEVDAFIESLIARYRANGSRADVWVRNKGPRKRGKRRRWRNGKSCWR